VGGSRESGKQKLMGERSKCWDSSKAVKIFAYEIQGGIKYDGVAKNVKALQNNTLESNSTMK
jgi:hypothetical protein